MEPSPDHAAPLKKLVEPWWLVRSTTGWWNPGGNLVEPSWNLTSNHPAALAEPGETLTEFWWKSGGTLVEPSSNRTTQPSKKLLEPWWNPGGTLPQTTPTTLQPWWNARGTLPQTTQTTPQPGTLVEPWRNPRETFLKPAALEEIGGTLVEPHLKLPRPPRPCRTWWNPGGTGGTLVELWWNLSSGSPRTTPEPIWAETPKLSAVGEKPPTKMGRVYDGNFGSASPGHLLLRYCCSLFVVRFLSAN